MAGNAAHVPNDGVLRLVGAQLLVTLRGWNAKPTHVDARTAVERALTACGVTDDETSATDIEICLPARNGGPVIAFVTANNDVLDKIYPLPEGDEDALPVKRIDGLQAHSLEVNVAFAGTPAADELLTNRANAYASATRSKCMLVFQDSKGAMPLECARTLEMARLLLEQEFQLKHPDADIAIPDPPTWASTREGQHKSKCSLVYRMHQSLWFNVETPLRHSY